MKADNFARLITDQDGRQVLALRTTADRNAVPVINIMIHGGDGIGVCVAGMEFPDTEGGWSLRDKAFVEISDESILDTASRLRSML